jgi:hypothetical protein
MEHPGPGLSSPSHWLTPQRHASQGARQSARLPKAALRGSILRGPGAAGWSLPPPEPQAWPPPWPTPTILTPGEGPGHPPGLKFPTSHNDNSQVWSYPSPEGADILQLLLQQFSIQANQMGGAKATHSLCRAPDPTLLSPQGRVCERTAGSRSSSTSKAEGMRQSQRDGSGGARLACKGSPLVAQAKRGQ